MHRFSLIAAAAAAALLGTTAHAASKPVTTSDLDLSTPAGQAELDSRIARAARAVCGGQSTDSRMRTLDRECMSKATASARAAIAANRAVKTGG